MPTQRPTTADRDVLYRSTPDQQSRGTVIVLGDLFGDTPQLHGICDRLAGLGAVAIAVNVYARVTDQVAFTQTDPGREAAFSALSRVRPGDLASDVDAVVRDAATDEPAGAGRLLGLVGVSSGAHLGFRTAATLPLPAVALAYPGWLTSPTPPFDVTGPAVDLIGAIEGRMEIYTGVEDALISSADRSAIDGRLRHDRHRLVSYPDAGHAFLDELSPGYRPDAAADVWKRVAKLLSLG